MNAKTFLKSAAVSLAFALVMTPALRADDDSDTEEQEDAAVQTEETDQETAAEPNENGKEEAGVPVEGEEIDYEALVPLEETPDPDEEGIDEEEREKRIQMREEAIRNREAKIAELRAQNEMDDAARAEAERRAALSKEMFEFLKEKDWERACLYWYYTAETRKKQAETPKKTPFRRKKTPSAIFPGRMSPR